MQQYAIIKCKNIFEHTKIFSLKMAHEAPERVGEKMIINPLFYCISTFCWCIKHIKSKTFHNSSFTTQFL